MTIPAFISHLFRKPKPEPASSLPDQPPGYRYGLKWPSCSILHGNPRSFWLDRGLWVGKSPCDTHREFVSWYRDILSPWLMMKRDYPWNNEPEPEPPRDLVRIFNCHEFHRSEIIREFERRT